MAGSETRSEGPRPPYLVPPTPLERSHTTEAWPDLQTLIESYGVEEIFAPATLRRLIVFDDVLTTGRHFKAVSHVLRKAFPEAAIVGLFLARRVKPASIPAGASAEDGADEPRR